MSIRNRFSTFHVKSGRFVPLFVALAAFSGAAFAGEVGTLTTKRGVARFFQDGAKLRLEWQSPSSRKGDLLVDNGQNVWVLHRAQNAATQTNSANRKVNLRAFGKVANAQDAEIPAAKFVFRLPEGAELLKIDGRLVASLAAAKNSAKWMKTPNDLPDGFEFESAIVGQDGVWLRYFDGKSRFSLFQQRADEGVMSLQKVEGGWFWKRGGVRFLLSGAGEEQARLVANGMN